MDDVRLAADVAMIGMAAYTAHWLVSVFVRRRFALWELMAFVTWIAICSAVVKWLWAWTGH